MLNLGAWLPIGRRMDYSRADVAHLLRRAGFGSTGAEVDALMGLPSWAAVVDQVLDTSASPADIIPPAVEEPSSTYYAPWVAGVHYWMDRMATTPTPIVEKMTLFWHGVFTTSVDKVTTTRLVFKQVRTYRSFALGDFHDLAQAMAIDPAMLLYLDNERNFVGRTNENFARELMEIFLLGRNGYQEAEVAEMARAWTGHAYDAATESYEFRPAEHDGGSKHLFGITRNWDGPATITEMVRGARQQVCARHIAGRLWEFLAGPTPSPATVNALASAFVASGMQIKELVRALFLHPEFRAPATRTGLVRSPVEWIAVTMRVLGLDAEISRPHGYMPRAGQKLFAPPTVAGWSGNEGWIDTASSWGRGDFAGYVRWKADDAGVFGGFGDLEPTDAVQRAFDRFGIDDPSPVTRAALETYVADEQAARRRRHIPPGLVAVLVLSPDFQMA